MQTAARPAMAHDQENVAPAAKAPHPAPEPEKKKKYVGARSRSSGRPARIPSRTRLGRSSHPSRFSRRPPRPRRAAPLTTTTAFPTATLGGHARDRPKEVKCPRVVTETYKDARSGETRTRSYVRGRPLGKGGFAVVYSMQDPSTGESFAAKVVAKSTLEKDRARQKILTEIRIHRSVDNAHVVKFKRCFEDKDNVYILMELCSDKTLADVVKRRGRLSESQCAPYLREIVSAVYHLHVDRRVIHRDLKLGNLFLTPAGLDEAGIANTDRRGRTSANEDDQSTSGPGSDAELGVDPRLGTRLKIGDFGLACVVDSLDDRKLTICGTPNYIAPEVLAGSKGGGHSFEVDVWSIGVILYASLVGTPPFQTSDVRATYKKIRANAYEFPKTDDGSGSFLLSQNAMDLISRCLAPKPSDRPSLVEIAKHPLCRVGAPGWRLPEKEKESKKESETKKRADAGEASSAERAPLAPRAAALLAAKHEKDASPSAIGQKQSKAPRAPLSPLPANLPARAAGRRRASPSGAQNVLSVPNEASPPAPPPAHPAAFDVLEAQDVAADPRSNRLGPEGPRRAAEEGAPRASEGVPAAPPASPRLRETFPLTRLVPNAARRGLPDGKESVSVRAAPSAAALMSAGAESSSSLNAHTDDDDDETSARVGRRVADAMMEKGDAFFSASASASTRRVPVSIPTADVSIASFPPVWVTKWVDYTSKYGLGYRLSDGTFGVVFNDATKMSQGEKCETNGSGSGSPSRRRAPREKKEDDAGDRLEYRERARRGSGSNPERENGGDGTAACVSFSASAPPPAGLEKKTKLMRHFRGYLTRDGRSAVEKTAGGLFDSFPDRDGSLPGSSLRGDEENVTPEVLPRAVAETRAAAARSSSNPSTSSSPYLPHVKNWLRTKHAILFRLSNRTIQVNFTDGSEILLSSEAQACVFVNPKTKRRAAHLLAKLPADPELLRRLRYVKEVLHQLVHRA